MMPLDTMTGMMMNVSDGVKVGDKPIPLEATVITVKIEGGLACVATERRFRNTGKTAMEATLTFPVPPRAVVHALQAKIGDRVLHGEVKAKEKARQSYEDGMDRGKASILHEIVASGIHMLSLGQLAAGEEAVITVTWAMPLSCGKDNDGSLIIPTTIGDIYGKPPMQDSDAPVHAAHVHMATLTVISDTPVTHDGKTIDESSSIGLNAPIVLHAVKPAWGIPLFGTVRAGVRVAKLVFAPGAVSTLPVTASILVDRSGSMGGTASAKAGTTKHQSAVSGLRLAAEEVREGDRIRLYEFDNDCNFLGEANNQSSFLELASRLGEPRGGTEIGGALQKVLRHGREGDVIVLTDGQSYHVDIGGTSLGGRRIHGVYIGEETLQGGLETLVKSSHGESFEAPVRCDDTIITAFGALRRSMLPSAVKDAEGQVVSACGTAGSTVVTASWEPMMEGVVPSADGMAQGIAAYAAFLSLPYSSNPEAVAVDAGIVSDLTSIVLIDEAGTTSEGLSETYKIALSTPRTMGGAMAFSANMVSLSMSASSYGGAAVRSRGLSVSASGYDMVSKSAGSGEEQARSSVSPMFRSIRVPDTTIGSTTAPAFNPVPAMLSGFMTLENIASMLDWDTDAARIQVGGVGAIPSRVLMAIGLLIDEAARKEAAAKGVDVSILILARAAQTVQGSRSAARFARRILG